jgi:hypothetical protein
MLNVFHVAVGFEAAPTPHTTIQAAFPPHAGWARYAPNCWLVSTSESAMTVATGIRTVIREMDTLFVCEVNLNNTYGYLQQGTWEWIKKDPPGGFRPA